MTNINADSANNTAMPKSHRHYDFGTFDERLAHLCALFEIDPPEITYEDGDPLLEDPLIDWIGVNDVNMDWLFAGSPCAMVQAWAKAHGQERKIIEFNRQLEPEVQAGFLTLLKAVVQHNLPIEESLAVFDKVVKEFRVSPEAKRAAKTPA